MCNFRSTTSTKKTSSTKTRSSRRPSTIPPPPPPPQRMPVIPKLPTHGKSFLEAKLTHEILETFQNNSHQMKLQKTEELVKAILQTLFPGIRIWSTGSFPAGVDLHNSDLDLTVKLPELSGVSGLDKLKGMKEKLAKRSEFSKCWVQRARVPVLQLKVAETGVEVDVTVDNDDGKRNTMLLAMYGQMDPRFQLLCRAVKAWSKAVGVEGAKNARLNSFSLCLMVILYLQTGVSPAILPNLQELFPELNGDVEVTDDEYGKKRNLKAEMEKMGVRMEKNQTSIGSLFTGFLKFWSRFDFTSNWISVRHAAIFPKRRDPEGKPLDGMPDSWSHICIQDPFISPSWNCGGSTCDASTFQRLREEFQLSLDRIQKARTMFGVHLKSGARRLIDEEGMATDERILERSKQIQAKSDVIFRRIIELWDKDDSGETLPDNYKEPSSYWDLERRRESNVKPWPVLVRIGLP